MNFPPLTPGIFVKRNNRFVAGIRLENGSVSSAYVPTTGRLTGVLTPGCRVWLEPAGDINRQTSFTLVLAELPGEGLCSTTAILANRLFEEAVENGALDPFSYSVIEREISFGKSRLDFRLSDRDQTCWVEVKSVTYAEDGIGRFPDAPTGRGLKHLLELADLTARGDRASVVFIAQREDAFQFMPFEEIDPQFAQVLSQVNQAGVEVHAFRCAVNTERIEIAEEIPVNLSV